MFRNFSTYHHIKALSPLSSLTLLGSCLFGPAHTAGVIVGGSLARGLNLHCIKKKKTLSNRFFFLFFFVVVFAVALFISA